ncbi:MAG: FtsQ-type POTRA domain-containing protein [Pseudomonadota bacterium]
MRRKRSPRWFAPMAIGFAIAATVFLPRFIRELERKIPFTVRNLHVQGAKALSKIEVQALSGIQEGGPLFGRWRDEALKKMALHPRLERVTVARDVTGQIVVRVAERKVAALVNLDRLHFVDRDGNVLEAADASSPEAAKLVVLTGPWKEKDAPSLSSRLTEGLEIRDALVQAGFAEKDISEIHFDPAFGWILYRMNTKTPAVIGWDLFGEKMKRLVRVLQDLKGKEGVVRELDLGFRDRAIVKIRK